MVLRQIFALATPSLKEYHRLVLNYSVLEHDEYCNSGVLAELLKAFLSNPHIAFYIRVLRAWNWRPSWRTQM